MNKWLKAILIISIVLVAGFIGYRTFLPKIILANVLSSFPNDAWRNEWIKNKIILIEFDEKTAKALGGHGPEVFRKNLIKALEIIDDVIPPRAIMIDATFESETAHDEKLQAKLDKMAHYTAWIYSNEKNRFKRRSDLVNFNGSTNLPLGHASVIYSTIAGKQLQLVTPCTISKDGRALPLLPLLAFQMSYGLNYNLRQNCQIWNITNSYDSRIRLIVSDSLLSQSDLKIKLHGDLPTLADRAGMKWMPIRFMGSEGFFKRISFIDVLVSEKKKNMVEQFFKFKDEIEGKIVLIGVTVPGASDRHMTEVGEMDGLEINANIIATIMRVFVEKNETVNK